MWEDIKGFVLNPGDVIQQLQDRMNAEFEATPGAESRRWELTQAITAKDVEKDRVLDAYRRGLMDIEALETHIIRSKFEMEPLQTELASIINSEAERGLAVGNLVSTESLLQELKSKIGGPLDWQTMRLVTENLVSGITVETAGEGRKKTATVTISYTFAEPKIEVDKCCT